MKAISIRLDDKLGREFDRVCQKTGYKKNTLVTRLISSFVSHQKDFLSRRQKKDPFVAVIGSLDLPALLDDSDTIDKIVYPS